MFVWRWSFVGLLIQGHPAKQPHLEKKNRKTSMLQLGDRQRGQLALEWAYDVGATHVASASSSRGSQTLHQTWFRRCWLIMPGRETIFWRPLAEREKGSMECSKNQFNVLLAQKDAKRTKSRCESEVSLFRAKHHL